MFCRNCGHELPENSMFCPKCASRVEVTATEEPFKNTAVTPADENDPEIKKSKRKPASKQPASEGERISDNIILCPDGKYRWVYEMSLFKNPSVFLLVWKILFFIIIGLFVFLTLVESVNSNFWWEGFLSTAKVFVYIIIGMTVVAALAYLLYAAVMGGKYIVEFEMDEKGINHKQTASQARKAKKLADATMIAGVAAGRMTTVGVGANAQRTEMYSEFSKVRKVKAYPGKNLIKVNELLGRNQVYAASEDFEFVKNYIISRCNNLKK